MSLGFKSIIDAIEAEIQTDYLPGAIRWADEKFDGAWSAALERFDKALSIAIERQDYRLAEIEGAYYKATVLDLLSRYKRHNKIQEDDLFLSNLREKAK